jgi:hypothetical protein
MRAVRNQFFTYLVGDIRPVTSGYDAPSDNGQIRRLAWPDVLACAGIFFALTLVSLTCLALDATRTHRHHTSREVVLTADDIRTNSAHELLDRAVSIFCGRSGRSAAQFPAASVRR